MLKMLETWRETNAPLWLLIGCIIFPIHENTIIHNYYDWTYHLFHVCKTFLAPQIGSNSYISMQVYNERLIVAQG